jgi:hypothetical protein
MMHNATQTESHFSKKPIPAGGSDSAMFYVPGSVGLGVVQAPNALWMPEN